MKTFKKWLFFVITFLYLVSPLIINYKIFISPVFTYAYRDGIEIKGKQFYVYFKYKYLNKTYEIELGDEYLRKEQIKLVFDKFNPKDYLIFSFAGLCLTTKMIGVHVLYLFFAASLFVPNKET